MKNANPILSSSLRNALACLTLLGLLACAASPSAQAAVIITTGGANDHELTSFSIDGTPYTTWTGITVNSIATTTTSPAHSYFQIAAGGTQPAAADRMNLVQDNFLGTSIANPRQLTVTFNAPVVNNTGTDILLFDFGAGDAFSLTINAQTNAILAASFAEVIASGSTFDQYRTDNTAVLNSLAAWTDPANAFSKITSPIASAISALEVDLSNFGVALGESVTTLSLASDAANRLDPAMIIGVIPEPSTFALLAGSLTALVVLRRRRATRC